MQSFKEYLITEKESPILKAAQKNDYNEVRMLLGDGEPASAQNRGGKTPMMFAAAKGNIKMAELLQDEGAGIESYDNTGITVLMTAAKAGKTDFVKWLIKQKVNLDATRRSDWESNALAVAIYSKKGPIIELLLDAGASTNFRMDGRNLFTAAYVCDNVPKTLKMMMDNGISGNVDMSNKHIILSMVNDKKFSDLAFIIFEDGISGSDTIEFLSDCIKNKHSYFNDRRIEDVIKDKGLETNKDLYRLLIAYDFTSPAALIAPNVDFSESESIEIYSRDLKTALYINPTVSNTSAFLDFLVKSCKHGYDELVQHLLSNGVTLDNITDEQMYTLEVSRLSDGSTMRQLAKELKRIGKDDQMLELQRKREESTGRIGSMNYSFSEFL